MRNVVAVIAIVYLVGVGVVLAPTVQAKWNTAPASDLAASISQELPVALAWPAALFRGMAGPGEPPARAPASS